MNDAIFYTILMVWFGLAFFDTAYVVAELEFNFYLLRERLQLQSVKVRYTVLVVCAFCVFIAAFFYVPVFVVKSLIDGEWWYPGKYAQSFAAYLLRKLRRKFHN